MTDPVNVFGRNGDVADLAYRVLGALDGSTVEGDPRTGVRVRGRLGDPASAFAVVEITTEHLGGPDGESQRSGMAGWLSRPDLDGPGRESALDLVPELVLSVSFRLEDDADQADQAVLDGLVGLAVRCAGWADGFVLSLTSGVVLGPDGEVWLEPAEPAGATDAPDPLSTEDEAELDPLVREGRRVLASEGLVEGGVVLDSDVDLGPPSEPPSTERIRWRLVVTAAVAARALNEVEGTYLAEARDALLTWVEDTGAAVELEPWEATLLAAAPGGVDERDLVDGSWRTEGALVLAWALGLMDLPAPDVVAVPGEVFASIGLADPDLTRSALVGVSPRSADELEVLRCRLLTVHWRLNQQRLHPGPLELASAVEAHRWGPLTVDGLELVGGDLAVDGRPLAEADPEAVRRATSIAVERHRAVNWLVDGGSFGDTDVST